MYVDAHADLQKTGVETGVLTAAEYEYFSRYSLRKSHEQAQTMPAKQGVAYLGPDGEVWRSKSFDTRIEWLTEPGYEKSMALTRSLLVTSSMFSVLALAAF